MAKDWQKIGYDNAMQMLEDNGVMDNLEKVEEAYYRVASNFRLMPSNYLPMDLQIPMTVGWDRWPQEKKEERRAFNKGFIGALENRIAELKMDQV